MKYLFISALLLITSSPSAEELRLSGTSTILTAESVKIDRTFIAKLMANPGATWEQWSEWGVTYSELGYFLLAGDKDAIKAGIKHLLYYKEHRDDYDDHYGTHELAVLISLSPGLDAALTEIDTNECNALSAYYIKHKSDYISQHDTPWLVKWCE